MKYILIISCALVVVLSMVWGATYAQPEPILPTAEPLCSPYFITQASAVVRTCADQSCAILRTLNQGESICVIGAADSPDWLWVDFDPYDPQNPPAYLPTSAVAANSADSPPRFATCQPMLVNGDQTNIYSCADANCKVLGFLQTDEWVCAREYTTGRYLGWAFAEQSDRDIAGWIPLPSLRPAGNYNIVAPAYQVPPQSQATAVRSSQNFIAADLENSAAPLDLPLPLPPCQQYQVVAFQTNVRECASLNCKVAQVLSNGAEVCVRGITPNKGWFIVDLAPDQPEPALNAVYQEALTPKSDFPEFSLNNSVCYDRWEIKSSVSTMVRSCPSLTCAEIDRLQYGDQVCVVAYGGGFNEWVQISGSEVVQNGWIHSSLARQVRSTPEADPNSPPVQPTQVAQLTPTPLVPVAATSVPLPNQAEDVYFTQLALPDTIELTVPRLSHTFRFTVPPTWQMREGSYLSLNLDYFSFLPATVDATSLPPSILSVTLDGVLIASIELDDRTPNGNPVVIPLPEVLFSRQANRQHQIQLNLIEIERCEVGGNTFVALQSAESFFHFEYDGSSPLLDLAQYPQPLYQPDFATSLQPIIMVLPDSPSLAEIRAGAYVAMGITATSQNNARILLRTPSTLTKEEQQNTTLIAIGNPNRNALIASWYQANLLLTQFDANGQFTYQGTPLDPTTGIWQVMANPENPQWAVAVITGTTPEAMTYAAHALTGSSSGYSGQLAFINDWRTGNTNPRFAAETTFQQLGYANLLVTSQKDEYLEFAIPYTTQIGAEAQLMLDFQISPELQNLRSDFSIWLNEEFPLSSVNIQELTATTAGAYQLAIPLPNNLLRRGQTNTVRFSLTSAEGGEDNCQAAPQSSSTRWLNLNPTSQLSLPNQPFPFDAQNLKVAHFPQPLSSQRNLDNLLVSLPPNPTLAELEQSYQLLALIAANTDAGENFLPQIILGDFPPETDLSQYNLLVIGRPSTNPILAAFNPLLVQPFVANTDTPETRYSAMPPQNDLGILQILPSPWSPQHAIFVITGTNATGQAIAMNVLLSPETDPASLDGNLTFITEQNLISVKTYEN